MSDCISRQAALDIFDDYNVAVENGQIEAYSRDRKRLCDLPPAQPERIKGRWISADAIFGGVLFYCSECGENTRDTTVMDKPRWNFCPNCGADMREVTT